MGETRNGQNIAKIPAKGSASLRLSADGRRLIVTRRFLTNRSDPNRRYSEIELWDVDAEELLLARQFEYGFIREMFLPGGRIAILASRSRKNEPEGFFEVMDANRGEVQWSSKLNHGFAKVLVPDESKDILVLKTGATGQVRDLATGKLIFEAAVGDKGAVATSRDGSLIIFGSRQDSMTTDECAIEIRTIESGDLLHKIPISGFIQDIAISFDGRFLLASIGSDSGNCVRIWRTGDWSGDPHD